MQIQVKFFASLRELTGITDQLLELESVCSVQQVWAQLVDEPVPANCLCSRNQQYAEWDETVENGDEVAFFHR